MAKIKWSAFPDGASITSGDETVGLRAGANTRLKANEFDNLSLNGNSIASTDAAGNINLDPHTTGLVVIQGSTGISAVIDDDTMATATATNIPTSESVKAYVDASASTNSSFFSYYATTDTNATGDGTAVTLTFDATISNVGADYDVLTGVYTAPVVGTYLFTAGVTLTGVIADTALMTVSMVIDGNPTRMFNQLATAVGSDGLYTLNVSAVKPLAAAGTASVILYVQQSSKTISIIPNGGTDLRTWFSGRLLG